MYDILVKNGHVIDSLLHIDKKCDIAVKNGRIVAADAEQEARKVVDAEGCYVTPGFIDAHTHLYYGGSGALSTNADVSCLPNCVTTGCDAGSTSIWNFDSFYRSEIVNSMTDIIAMLHPCITGVQLPPAEEDQNPNNFDAEAIREFFRKYPDTLRGLKIRMSKGTVRGYGISPIKRAVEIADSIQEEKLHCMITCHFSDLADGVSMEMLLDTLRPGDVISHIFHPAGESIFNPDGSIMECVDRAREKGIMFDSSRGRINFSVENICKASEQGFFPDIISTDLGRHTLYLKPNFSILNSMSLFLNVGMPLKDIIKAVTYNPAKAFGIVERAGSLREGSNADIAIIKIIDLKRTYADTVGGKFVGEKLMIPMATIKAGQVVFQQIFMDDQLT